MLGKWKILHVHHRRASEVVDFNAAEVCCLPYWGLLHYLHNGMEKGLKVWYAGEGEQEQNYLTQLVLQTWEENSFKANYFPGNQQRFTSSNAMKNDRVRPEKWAKGSDRC